jgi:hypothetical protein
MFKQFTRFVVFLYALINISISFCWAGDDSPLVITPIPGKAVCKPSSGAINDKSVKSELCVTQGNFSHDVYMLKINGKPVLKGIDEDTTKGISSTFQNQKINLTCTPQHKGPSEVSQEKIETTQKAIPNLSVEDARKMAIMMETVETGRLCIASSGESPFMTVQVNFE